MSNVCIEVRKLDSSFYEWAIEGYDSDLGYRSIVECLSAAPHPGDLIEIKYNHIHMGTFRTIDLNDSNLTATVDKMMAEYACLLQVFN